MTPVVQVNQRGGGGFGMGAIIGVLAGVILVVVLIITLVNNQGDDGSTPATDAPVTTLDADSG